MKAIQALKAALAAATPDWVAVSPNDSSNDGGTHIEIHDGYGRTAMVYGEPEDQEVIANASLMALAQNHMGDLLEAVNALHILREAYLNDDPKILDVIQGVLAGDVVTDLIGRLTAGEQIPEETNPIAHRAKMLATLKADGLTIGECITALAVPNDDHYVKVARKLTESDDDVQIDGDTTTSVGEDGAWVLAWLWVSNDEAGVISNSDLLKEVLNCAILQIDYAKSQTSTEALLQAIGGRNIHDLEVFADWLGNLTENKSDFLDTLESETQRGNPGKVTWVGKDGEATSFFASKALAQLVAISRCRGGCLSDTRARLAEEFLARLGPSLDAILPYWEV